MESPNQRGARPQQKKYVVGGARGLGGAQILFAGLLMTFGIIGIVIQTQVYFAGTPIWTGLVYLVTGILGVVSSHRNTKCVIARFTIDAANLLFALVELGLSIATIAVCSYTLCKGCCGEGGSCCRNGNTGNSYQNMYQVGQGGRLVPVQGFANINYAPAHSAHAPSYVISSPIPPQHGDVQQGMAAGTGDQAMALAHAQQQQQLQQKNEPQQHQQGASPDAHAQPGYVSPPPGYNQA